jgi:hypothetical protein
MISKSFAAMSVLKLLSAAAHAGSAPKELYGKSIIVTRSEHRSQREFGNAINNMGWVFRKKARTRAEHWYAPKKGTHSRRLAYGGGSRTMVLRPARRDVRRRSATQQCPHERDDAAGDDLIGRLVLALKRARRWFAPWRKTRVRLKPSESSSARRASWMLRRYWSNACRNCELKHRCTTGTQRRITRWEDENVLELVQKRLDENPQAMRQRRETVEHPFGTMKARMGATHFLMKTLPKVATEMALSVLAYNLTRVINIVSVCSLIAAMKASKREALVV